MHVSMRLFSAGERRNATIGVVPEDNPDQRVAGRSIAQTTRPTAGTTRPVVRFIAASMAALALLGPIGIGAAQAAPPKAAWQSNSHAASSAPAWKTGPQLRGGQGELPSARLPAARLPAATGTPVWQHAQGTAGVPAWQQHSPGGGVPAWQQRSQGTAGAPAWQRNADPGVRLRPGGAPASGHWNGQPWATHAQQVHPDMRTTIINNNVRYSGPRVVNINQYHVEHYGSDYRGHSRGFYAAGGFFAGLAVGELIASHHDYYQQPVYIVSPVTGDMCGQLQPPNGSDFDNEQQLDLQVLGMMANPQQPPDQFDPTAGVYVDNGRFNPDQPDPNLKVSAAGAYNQLRHGGAIYFHAPNGGFEQLTSLDDLQSYVYTQEAPPPQ